MKPYLHFNLERHTKGLEYEVILKEEAFQLFADAIAEPFNFPFTLYGFVDFYGS